MRFRPAPTAATWLLRQFCSSTEHESVVGDLLEQYQLGRSRFWYWRQVIGIGFLGLYGKAVRRPLVPARRMPMRQGFAVILFIAVLAAVLLSDIWILFLVGVLGGVIMGFLKFGLGNGRTGPTKSHGPGLPRIQTDRPITDGVTLHRGISMQHIPVEGAVGLLFVVATVLIFAGGIPAVRGILVVTVPVGLLGSAILFYWHKRHPLKIQALDLHKQKQNH